MNKAVSYVLGQWEPLEVYLKKHRSDIAKGQSAANP